MGIIDDGWMEWVVFMLFDIVFNDIFRIDGGLICLSVWGKLDSLVKLYD